MSGEPNEDLIEATIRRVAEAAAARESTPADGASASEAGAEAPPRQAAPGQSAPADTAAVEPAPLEVQTAAAAEPAPPRAIDESLIEATIRRVAAARAANEAALTPAVEEDGAPPTPISAGPWAAAPAMPAADGDTRGELLALQREVGAMRGMLAELEARVHAALASTHGDSPASDDDWDEAPVLPRLAIGSTPRRPVLRDTAPRAAVAEAVPVKEEAAPVPTSAARPAPPHPGIDLLPRTYRVTVEDKRRGVDLVPLHRALLAMDGVRDMSLLSYSNGVAIVSVEMVHGLDPDVLREAVAGAMLRDARVESHNETTMVVKLAEE